MLGCGRSGWSLMTSGSKALTIGPEALSSCSGSTSGHALRSNCSMPFLGLLWEGGGAPSTEGLSASGWRRAPSRNSASSASFAHSAANLSHVALLAIGCRRVCPSPALLCGPAVLKRSPCRGSCRQCEAPAIPVLRARFRDRTGRAFDH
jgi:hypothetical protein